jgi:perosamine synthetase
MQMFDAAELNRVSQSLQAYISGCLADPSLQQQHLAGAGPIHLLERKLQDFYQKKFAVVFSSATAAMQTLALALDLKNAEIITSPINWGGSIAPFLLHGNKLRFAAYDPLTLNLCASDLIAGRTARTKAVLSVDYNGVPADSKTIKEFCEKHNLIYISDSAQSLGAFRDGYPAGFFADVIVLSFSPGKSIFAGEGGAVLTDDEEIYQRILWFSQHPSRQKAVSGLSNYNEYAPINGRMNPLAAILLYETFDAKLSGLKIRQHKSFALIQDLTHARLVTSPCYLDRAEASTYFNISLELNPSATVEMVNSFLKQQGHPFVAREDSVRLIPFDPSFVRQFRGWFSYTRCLEDLRRKECSIQRITLHNSPVLSCRGKDN